ncbi:MAG: prolipoprotein diacylglyceryl transferase, partial [Patescibacteria group bacterium]
MFIFNFFHEYHPQPVIFQLGMFSFRWYGLLMAMAVGIGLLLTIRLAKGSIIGSEKIWGLAPYLIIFGFIGARLYHVLSEIDYYLKRPLEIFYVWRGGLGIFGTIIAGALVLLFYTRKNQISFWLLADLLAPSLALGEAIVRWGNWFNQENFGRPTNLPWGIPVDW